jgi:2-iminobutanoate/2-iminopropanoate deaminase
MLKQIKPKGSKVIGPYSPAVVSGKTVYLSGQIGVDGEGNLVSDEVADQTRKALQNLKKVLEAAGSSIEKVCKTTLFFSDLSDYGEVNEIYADFFGDHKPARAAVEVSKLPKDAKIEIQAIAQVA